MGTIAVEVVPPPPINRLPKALTADTAAVEPFVPVIFGRREEVRDNVRSMTDPDAPQSAIIFWGAIKYLIWYCIHYGKYIYIFFN